MTRKPISWTKFLKQVFRRSACNERRPHLQVEHLCDRIVPAAWNVTPLGAEFDGDFVISLSLREASFLANNDSDTTQTINLVGVSTYTLDIANTSGQENLAAEGDLDIVDEAGVAGTKIYNIVGFGGN